MRLCKRCGERPTASTDADHCTRCLQRICQPVRKQRYDPQAAYFRNKRDAKHELGKWK